MDSNSKIILAQNAEEGKTYLSAVMKYKIKIIKRHLYNDSDGKTECSSVTVEAENCPNRQISISGGTELIEYSEATHVPSASRDQIPEIAARPHATAKPEVTKSSTKKEPTTMAEVNETSPEVMGVPAEGVAAAEAPAEEAANVTAPEAAETPAKPKKEKKERVKNNGPKMSDIIIPMIAQGIAPDAIAKEVLKTFPDRNEKQLISMIKGPYTMNYNRRKDKAAGAPATEVPAAPEA